MDLGELFRLDAYLPSRVNHGPWVTAYTLFHLREQRDAQWILPICSLATPYEEIIELGPWLLPPLFYEAMDENLQQRAVQRICECFPVYAHGGGECSAVRVVELPRHDLPSVKTPRILAFSVDTAVEEHGPHLPLSTDTIQSYDSLRRAQSRHNQLELFRPVEYGQLTWGLPFGMSVDFTAELLREYVARLATAVQRWLQPDAMYVVDVHGSIVHRQAIVEGLQRSEAERWLFRWLHEPLAEFASGRGDQHAGGVETILVERASPDLLDDNWWPARIDEIADKQMDFDTAVRLTPDLPAFCQEVEASGWNGIVGDIRNYHQLDGDELVRRIDEVTESDIQALLAGRAEQGQDAGQQLW